MSSLRVASGPVHRVHLSFLVFVCVASTLGGLLWGFDAIVISGTTDAVTAQFRLSPGMEGFFVSSGLLGAVIGSALAGWLADRFGRRRNLLLAAVLMWVSAIGSAFAPDIGLLVFARWLGGVGVGISAMICPLYLSEISPAHLRGRLVTLFQFAITAGIMIALLNNLGIVRGSAAVANRVAAGGFLEWILVAENWRAMFASELIPGTLFLVLAARLPESPRWLVGAGRPDQAKAVLHRVLRTGADEELAAITASQAANKARQPRPGEVFSPRYRRALVIAVLLAAFAQLSGINTVFYYGTSLLKEVGLDPDGAFSGMAVIGFFNMVFTTVAVVFVDKLGRRLLLQVGSLGVIGCLVGMSFCFANQKTGFLLILICTFVAFFAFSLGPIKFIFAAEIFPTRIRSHAVAIVILTMWSSDWLVAQCVPTLRDGVGAAGLFLIFAACVLPQVFMVWKFMPETAGRSLEEIERGYRS